MLTILTATYNRAYILPKLYNSLKYQTNENFEWIIVDDDSNDNTGQLIKSFENVGHGITYLKQKHGGKHRAINLGIKYAQGEYTFIVDSDDRITLDAVEFINSWTEKIRKEDNYLCGVAGLRISEKGDIWGGRPRFQSGNYVVASNLEREKYHLEGDKAEVYRTDILKKHPFPEFPGEYFVTEAAVWDVIALEGYKLIWYDVPIYICEYLNDGLTNNGANSLEGNLHNFNGFAYYVKVYLLSRNKKKSLEMFGYYNKIARILRKDIKLRANTIEMKKNTYVVWMIESYFARIISYIKNRWDDVIQWVRLILNPEQ